jgi:hypothetical protein
MRYSDGQRARRMKNAALRRIWRSADPTRGMLPGVGLLCAGILATALLIPGCSAGGNPLAGLTSPFGGSGMDARLRKQVQADPFPTAQQAGL